MNSEVLDSVRITTLGDFLEWAQSLTPGEYLFRGVSKTEHKIEASAYRRLEGKDRNFKNFLKINKELIKDARLQGLGIKDGRDLKDLEVLAALQHAEAATCLIDFTYSALIALWFACGNELSDGKVFAVSSRRLKFTEITPELLEKNIDCLLKDPTSSDAKLYQWRPWQLNNRIGPQQSVFLFGVSEIDPHIECIIDGTRKTTLQNQLQQNGNITKATLFPDLDGFARRHRHDIRDVQPSSKDYEEIANFAYLRENYWEAIANFNKAIDLKKDNANAYYQRGLAKYNLKKYQEAIDDFDKAIALEKESDLEIEAADIYYQRGLAKFDLEQYKEAIADFNEAIQRNLNDVNIYYKRGLARYNLKQYEEAIIDLTR